MQLSIESTVHLKRFTQNQAHKKVEETEKDNMREKVGTVELVQHIVESLSSKHFKSIFICLTQHNGKHPICYFSLLCFH